MEETQLIDLHHHIIPKEYVESLSDKGVKKAIGVQFPDWNVNKTLEIMDKNGISVSFISISAPGVYFKDQNSSMSLQKNYLQRQMKYVLS